MTLLTTDNQNHPNDTAESAVGPAPAVTGETTRVTVVVPCYNERESVDHLAEHLTEFQASVADVYEIEFLLVDDGSQDGTPQILSDMFGDRPNFRIILHERNQGVAAAIMTGVRHARAPIACSIDSDCTYRLSQLAEMIPLMIDDVSMVTASPYHPEGAVVNVPAWRLALSRCASALYRSVMRSKLYCYTSCCRVYRRDAMLNINLRREGFVGVAELIWQLDRRGGRVIEYPAVLHTRQFGASKMRMVRTTTQHLRLIGRILCWRIAGTVQARPDRSLIKTDPAPQPLTSVQS